MKWKIRRLKTGVVPWALSRGDPKFALLGGYYVELFHTFEEARQSMIHQMYQEAELDA